MHSSSETLRHDALHIEADTIQWHLQTIEDLHHQKNYWRLLDQRPVHPPSHRFGSWFALCDMQHFLFEGLTEINDLDTRWIT